MTGRLGSRLAAGLVRCCTSSMAAPALGFWLASMAVAGGAGLLQARQEPASGQIELFEGDFLILRYNYRMVEPGKWLDQISAGNRIYARPRSDYVHPLNGLHGQELTRDWPLDHPHHRGIYWAWPEVDWGTNRGDLHALQKVFARPTGRVKTSVGADYAQVEAENQWLWEDRLPLVRELACLRAWRANDRGRVVDLAFQFEALTNNVRLARRGADKYGGLNIRLQKPEGQQIQLLADPPGSAPRRAWSDLSGVFPGGDLSGLAVFQHRQNPDYPGDWIQYPDLSWVQPGFPAKGTRWELTPGKPLILRYRLWIHPGRPTPEELNRQWYVWQAANADLPAFGFGP